MTNDNRPNVTVPARLDALKTPAICVLLLFFETFSVMSTSWGLYAFFGGFSNMPIMIGWIIVCALATGFHLLSLAWLFRHRQTRHLSALAPYLVFCAVAILFSVSWHWWHFRGAEVAGEDLAAKVAQMERALYTAKGSLTLISEKTGELAAYSARRATDEKAHGHTCGDSSGPTEGKRWLVRQDDMQEFRSISDAAAQHLREFDSLLNQTRDLAHARDGVALASQRLDGVNNQLQAFATNDAAIADIRDRVQQRLHLSQTGYNVPGYGFTRCPDPMRDELLNGVLKAATMPAVATVQVLNPDSLPEAQKRIWGRAANSLSILWTKLAGGIAAPAVQNDQLEFHDYLALLAAGFVEFSVLMCVLWLPRPRRGSNAWADDLEGFDDERSQTLIAAFRRIAEGLTGSEAALLAVFEEHLWWPNATDDPILVVPMSPPATALPQLYHFAELLVELDLARIPAAHLMYMARLRFAPGAPPLLRALAQSSALRLYSVDRHAQRQLTVALTLRGFRKAA